MDCGMKVHDHNEPPLLDKFKFDACILSHAHLDHSGSLPVLYKHATIPTFCTFPTIPITTLLLEDSEKLARLEGKQLPYKATDTAKLYKKFTPLPYRSEYEFFDGSSFEFYDAGHIPGSAGILFNAKEQGKKKSVFYTGDLNYADTRLLEKAKLPEGGVDALIIESTYAFRDHTDRKKLEKTFVDSVRACLEDDAVALVSTFAVGRSQEILLVLDALLKTRDKIFIDGMGQKVARLLSDFPSYVRNYKALAHALETASFVEGNSMRKRVPTKPGVIVTTSGMLDGGPILSYLEALNARGKGKIFLTGFQVEGSNGRALLEGRELSINGRSRKIVLPFEHFDFSAHASATQLREVIRKVNPGKVYCVHGDSCEAFAKDLKEKDGFDAFAPALAETHVV